MGFQTDLRELINSHCLENESNTPDFILAEYILDVLNGYNIATKKRDDFYGVDHNEKPVINSPNNP